MSDVFNPSEQERRLIARRAAFRAKLKQEWRKLESNPKQAGTGYIFDPQIQRLETARVSIQESFKPTFGGFIRVPGFLMLSLAVLTYLVHSDRTQVDTACREGRLAYQDRIYRLYR